MVAVGDGGGGQGPKSASLSVDGIHPRGSHREDPEKEGDDGQQWKTFSSSPPIAML